MSKICNSSKRHSYCPTRCMYLGLGSNIMGFVLQLHIVKCPYVISCCCKGSFMSQSKLYILQWCKGFFPPTLLPFMYLTHPHTSSLPTVHICVVFLDASLRPHNADSTVSCWWPGFSFIYALCVLFSYLIWTLCKGPSYHSGEFFLFLEVAVCLF